MPSATITLDAEPVLDAAELTQLQRLEALVENGLQTFIEVGEALSAIRERRLYRATHGTFEDYCVNKWGMKKAHAYRLMTAAEIVSPMGDEAKAITSERQARELSRVPAPERAAVVEKALQATGGKLTAPAINRAAAEIVTPPAPVAVEVAPDADGPTPYQAWCMANRNKRKKSPPPPRTEEELVGELADILSYSRLFECRNHPDDISRVRRLLPKAWDEAVRIDREQREQDAKEAQP